MVSVHCYSQLLIVNNLQKDNKDVMLFKVFNSGYKFVISPEHFISN